MFRNTRAKALICMLIAFALTGFSCCMAAEAMEDPALERLDRFAADVMELKTRSFGFPGNQDVRLTDFYQWLIDSGLDTAIVNNAGDPFNNTDPSLNALDFEREVIEFFAPLYGFDPDDLWGIVTFSGTDGNNHGIYFGSKYLEKKTQKKPVMYVSDAAHYSNMRLADLQNLDIVLVPSDEHGRMIPEELEKALVPDRPALMVYAMGTTFKGGIDDQDALNAVLANHPDIEVYRHVDAALFGGYLPYTQYSDIVNRKVHPFDSIAVSGHKFFGMDEPAGIFLTTMTIKDNQNPFEVTYLNGSMPMINCSRSAISPLKLWWLIHNTGIEGFTEQATGMLERAEWLKDQLDGMGWPAWLEPMSNTVYFKRPPEEIAEKYTLAPDYDERLGGELSHIVVMQHVTKDRLQGFLDDLASTISEDDAYTLEQVVVLSRHNLRAPLSSNGSVPDELTPHAWTQWTANSSELTLKGGIQETSMGEYFRKWLDKEGLIPENTVPEDGEVRFYARDKQRCRATARYFATGMLPLADIAVEHPGEPYNTVDFMKPAIHFYSDAYAADATAQVAAMGGDAGFDGLAEQTRDAIRLIMDTVDMEDSEVYKSGKYGDLLADGSGYKVEPDKEPDVTGAIKTASQVGDALILQYYEEADAEKAAFGHTMTEDDWATIGNFMATYSNMRHGAPLIAVNIAHPLLRELEGELKNEQRKFSFLCAHDVTIIDTLSALGAEPYALPESVEPRTPIGVKLLFERWRDGEGQAWYRVDLVYRSTEQIRNSELLTLDNPPKRYDLRFEGVETNENGLIAESDLIDLFDRSIAAFDALEDAYALPDDYTLADAA